MDKNSIIQLLSIGENSEIEFKESKNKLPKSLWETYSAFCNTKGRHNRFRDKGR
jgi:predicted HTH transcriptional regulator